MDILKTLQALNACHGPAGDESGIADAIEALAAPYADKIKRDTMGNLIVRKKGKGPKIMFAAHMDSIGFVVTHIDEHGFLRFGKVGGLHAFDLLSTPVRFKNGVRGVVCLDISGLSLHSGRRSSFDSGSRMLWYTAHTLEEIFGPALLFRTREAEFTVFYPNTTREVFLACCGRLRSILQRRYPRQMRIGRAWAEGEFAGRQLVKKAQASMHLEIVLSEGDGEQAGGIEDRSSVSEAVRDGGFTVYYQPKIDIRTGALSGAEALVRGVGEDGAIIPPSQFIPYLEDAGSIRELDLFVLEQSLSQLEQWRAAGLGIVPVAVNLSRTTLAHPSTLASVLAIQSRYPEIPASALELEVTERDSGIEASAFRAIVDRFHACGLRLGLDDFGSQYANLSLFTNVKFDTIKMDRSLIADVVHNPIAQTLVQDIVQICRTHHMTCVAEGVENRAQLDVLLKMGCPYAQGYYYDRPLPAQAFAEKYLRGGTPSERRETRKEDCI